MLLEMLLVVFILDISTSSSSPQSVNFLMAWSNGKVNITACNASHQIGIFDEWIKKVSCLNEIQTRMSQWNDT